MINRRQLLQHAAVGVALTALQLPLHAAESAISLGFSLYGMKSLPIGDSLKICAEIGYRNVELTLTTGYPTEPRLLSPSDRQALRESLAKYCLSVSGLMDNLSLVADEAAHAKNLDRIEAAAELAHALAPDKPPIFETVLGGKSADWDSLKARMVDQAGDWATIAAKNGLTVCLKPHVYSAIDSPERLLWLHQQVASPFVKLCYDFSHFEVQGMEMESTLKPLISETRFIHLKDTAGDVKKVQFLLPGEGRTDYAHYSALLKTVNWSGPVVVEVSAMVFNKPGYDPVAAAKKCFAALSPKFVTP